MIEPRLFYEEQTEVTSDDYYTPKWIFDTLGLSYDLDVASPPGGAPFVPCDKYYTQKDDGLVSEWYGRVWMNPPYSNTAPWIDRWLRHGNGVALLPMVQGSKWQTPLWDSRAACKNLLNVKFHRPDGSLAQPWTPLWLWAIGDDCIQALRNFGKIR
jgi:hypothetical protein